MIIPLLLVVFTAMFLSPAAQAQQFAIRDLFWAQVAPLTPALYCAADVFALRSGDNYSIEHVYPRSWMRQTLGCQGDTCEANGDFIIWENDLRGKLTASP